MQDIPKMHDVILDGGMAAVATGTAQIAATQDTDLWPLIIGVAAPIVKEALFRLIDKIGTIRKARKERRAK